VTVTSTLGPNPTVDGGSMDTGDGAASKSFMQNKPLSRAIFAISGIFGFVALAVVVAFFVRRIQRKRLLRQAISFDPKIDISTVDREAGGGREQGGGSMDHYVHSEHGSSRGPGGSTEAIINLLDGSRNVDPSFQEPVYPQQTHAAQGLPRERYAYPGQPFPGQVPAALQPGHNPARYANPIFEPTNRGFSVPAQQPDANTVYMAQTSSGATLPGRNLIYQTSASDVPALPALPDTFGSRDDEMWRNAYVGLAPDTPRVLRVANE